MDALEYVVRHIAEDGSTMHSPYILFIPYNTERNNTASVCVSKRLEVCITVNFVQRSVVNYVEYMEEKGR